MMSDTVQKRKTACPSCGNSLFVATWNFSTHPSTRVWECTNCQSQSPRVQRQRLTNRQKANAAWREIQNEWDEVDKALHTVIEQGAPNGCLLVHGSVFNHNMKMLASDEKLTNFELRYHIKQARRDLEQAKAFLASKLSQQA